MTTKQYSSIPK